MSDVPPNSELGGYRIERLVGRGGMSVVYLAEHVRLKRKVALKVLSPELAKDERFRERFIRESELAASLEDPNVLPIYEAGEQDGVLFIAMRYLDGTDLKTLLDRRVRSSRLGSPPSSDRWRARSTPPTRRVSCTVTSSRGTSW
ncbi:MAG: protein kinase [Actinomycetota bacterium]